MTTVTASPSFNATIKAISNGSLAGTHSIAAFKNSMNFTKEMKSISDQNKKISELAKAMAVPGKIHKRQAVPGAAFSFSTTLPVVRMQAAREKRRLTPVPDLLIEACSFWPFRSALGIGVLLLFVLPLGPPMHFP